MRPQKKKISEAQRLLDAGYTQKQIAKIAGIPERSQRRYLANGILLKPAWKKVSRRKAGTEVLDYVWTDITASDLLNAGFTPRGLPMIIASLHIARKQENTRAHRYLKGMLEYQNMHPDWRAVLAGFPIIADDIGAPSMARLAELVKELYPLEKPLRREYNRRVRPILVGILAEVQSFILDAANTVDEVTQKRGFPLVIMPGKGSRRLWGGKHGGERMGVDEAQDRLGEGNWMAIPMAELGALPLENTWAGTLYDIVSRLPEPDRQRGKLLGKLQLSQILYTWCFTAPRDFVPPLSQIRRRDRFGEPGPTGLFLRWKALVEHERSEEKQAWLVEPVLPSGESKAN